MRFKKSTFLVQKVHFLGSCTPPKKSILITGLAKPTNGLSQCLVHLIIFIILNGWVLNIFFLMSILLVIMSHYINLHLHNFH